MKKLSAVLAFAALCSVGAATVFAGGGPGTGVNGSMHDITYMNNQSPDVYWQDQYQRVCIFCHTPHNAMTTNDTVDPAPLWNHQVTTISPQPYQWVAPANAGINIADPLTGPTRLCLGCHDGQTAVASHGGAGQNNNNTVPMNPLGGKVINDLTVTHPVGFHYSQAIIERNTDPIKPELVDPNMFFIDRVLEDANAVNNDTNTRAGWTYTQKRISDTLYQGDIVTCATCHEVHNYRNSTNDPQVDPTGNANGGNPNYFVWAREKGSALCLSCHYK